jgi:hypothetical protein
LITCIRRFCLDGNSLRPVEGENVENLCHKVDLKWRTLDGISQFDSITWKAGWLRRSSSNFCFSTSHEAKIIHFFPLVRLKKPENSIKSALFHFKPSRERMNSLNKCLQNIQKKPSNYFPN